MLYTCVIYMYMFTCVCVHVWTVHTCMNVETRCWLLMSSYITIYLLFLFQDFYFYSFMYLCPWKPERWRGVGSAGAGVLGTPLDLKLNSAFPEKQKAVLNIEPSLQPLSPLSLRQDLSLNLEIINWARLTDQ